ncbi:MAG: 1-acyl-sn-glycerol-3-phosphate acyltransferase [Planctomycetaceae bacterium]|nr:1-acyl-sn-glycerol-3-phosphate acyltransferase [Planctomycetaceae bacterium]
MAKTNFKEGRFRRVWHCSARILVDSLLYLLYRVQVYGKKNVPRQGALLVLSNHQSFIDPIVCQNWMHRLLWFVPRDSLFHGLWGMVLDSFYTIPISQEHSDIAAMRTIIDVLKRGEAVCLYPEGSRTLDGRIDEFKPGFGLLVRRSGASVLPMVIEGLHEIWPRGTKLPRLWGRLPIGILYGKPIPLEYVKEVGEERFVAEFNRTLQAMHNELRAKMNRPQIDYSSPAPQ